MKLDFYNDLNGLSNKALDFIMEPLGDENKVLSIRLFLNEMDSLIDFCFKFHYIRVEPIDLNILSKVLSYLKRGYTNHFSGGRFSEGKNG